MPDIEKSPNGKWYELVNNEWRLYDGITPDDMAAVEQYRNESPIAGIGQGVMNMLGADYWAPSLLGMTENEYQASKQLQRQDTPLSVLGGEIGTGITGALIAGPSAAAQIGTGAAFGAAMDSENPLGGAALGGTLGAIIPAGQAAYNSRYALGGAIERGLTGMAESLDVVASGLPMGSRMGFAGGETTTAAQRVLSRMGMGVGRGGGNATAAGAADDGERILQGFLTPEEAAQSALPLTYGDELALAARTQEQIRHADRIRMAEELRRSDEIAGAPVRMVRDAQQDWATTQVKARLGINTNANITDDVLGTRLNQLGQQFDQFADDIGSVPMTDDFIAQIDNVAEQATGPHAGQIQRIAEDAKKLASQNDGALTGADWQILRSRLGKMIAAGGKQGDTAKIADAVEMQEAFLQQMESWLPQASQEAMQLTRSQYGLAKTLLSRAGNLTADGRVNSRSLYGALKTAGRIRNRHDDSLIRLLETDRYLTDRVLPTSGTAERLLANPVRTGINAGIGAGLSGGAAAGFNTLFGD